MLAVFKRDLQTIAQPFPKGLVFTMIRARFEQEDIKTDTEINYGGDLGKLMNFFIVSPGQTRDVPQTVGNPGFSRIEQDILITGFISVKEQGGPDILLNLQFDRIRNKLRKLRRLDEVNAPSAVHLRRMIASPIDQVRVGKTLCHFKTLQTVVEDRADAN